MTDSEKPSSNALILWIIATLLLVQVILTIRPSLVPRQYELMHATPAMFESLLAEKAAGGWRFVAAIPNRSSFVYVFEK